jgi:hypothetical protein
VVAIFHSKQNTQKLIMDATILDEFTMAMVTRKNYDQLEKVHTVQEISIYLKFSIFP